MNRNMMCESDESRHRQVSLPLTDNQKALMFATALQDRALFRTMEARLDPATHFRGMNQPYGLLWKAAIKLYGENEELPDLEALVAEIENLLQDSMYEELSDEDLSVCNMMIDAARRLTGTDLSKKSRASRGYLKRYLSEQATEQLRTKLAVPGVDLTQVLDLFQTEHNKISSVTTVGLKAPIPKDIRAGVKPVVKVPTGCSFLDFYMKGQANQEIYGFLAPYGGGKTVCSTQLCVNRCRHEQAAWAADNRLSIERPLPIVYFVTYEEEEETLIHRLLSYAAFVDKDLIEDAKWNEMSTLKRQNYKPYEKQVYKAMFEEGLAVPGEWDRIVSEQKVINRNLRIIDFTGSRPEFAEPAAALARGIADVIEADQAENNHPGVSLVVIDYAGAAARRNCEYCNLDPDRNMRHLIGGFPMSCKHNLASPYKCPVWIMHQLNTKANERSPGQVPKPTDVSEAKNFFENVTYGFMLGTKTKDHLAIITNGKQRRTEARHDRVVRIDGKFSRIVDTSHEFRIDNGKIIPAKAYEMLADDDDQKEPVFERNSSKTGEKYPLSRNRR